MAGRIQTTKKLVQAANNGQNFAFPNRLAQEVDMNIPLQEKNLNKLKLRKSFSQKSVRKTVSTT